MSRQSAWTPRRSQPRSRVCRAHEARYFKNKYDHDFTVEPASDAETTIEWVQRILDNPKKRAVGFKLSEGMEVPATLPSKTIIDACVRPRH